MHKLETSVYVDAITKNVKERLNDDKYKLICKPHIVVIKVGDDPSSNKLLEHKKLACEKLGIKFKIYDYKSSVTTEYLKTIISKLSLDPSVTGIIVQTPLPEHINERELIDEIDPIKDIEGVTLTQSGMLHLGVINKNLLIPYIAKAICKIIFNSKELQYDSLITVMGSDNYIGKAVISILEQENIGLVSCPSNVKNIDIYTDKSSILVLVSLENSVYNSYRYLYGETKKLLINVSSNIININKQNSLTNLVIADDLEELIIAEMLDNICIAYENQFDFIWKYCKNLKFKIYDYESEDNLNIINLDIPENQWYITQENFDKYKDLFLSNIDLTKKNLIVIPAHIKSIPMHIVEQFVKLFPDLKRKDFNKYFEVQASKRVVKKIYDTLNIFII